MSIAAICQARLDAWCNQPTNCPHAEGGTLHARLDTNQHGHPPMWRCYAASTLSSDLSRYAGGTTYCSRQLALASLLEQCQQQATTAAATVAAEVSPTGNVSPSPPAPPPKETLPELELSETWQKLPPWTERGVLTLPALHNPEWSPSPDNELLAVHAWKVDCMNDFEVHKKKLNKYTGNVSRRKAFLKRDALACYGTCVRGVVDGFATHGEMAELIEGLKPPKPDPPNPSAIQTWRWEVPRAPALFARIVARAQTVLRERFGVDKLRFYRSNMITWQRHGDDEVAQAEWPSVEPRKWRPSAMHGDTNTDEMFMYTTILYLTEHGVDGVGAETGIVDAVDESKGIVNAGLRVQPGVGRLLVFSAGVENMHEMLQLAHGKRIAIQMWFACDGQQPGWAAPQRAAFEKEHGYGGHDGTRPPPAPERSQFMDEARPWPWRPGRKDRV